MIEIVPFDALSATREEWTRYHEFRRLRHEETSPEDPVMTDDVAEELLRRPIEQSKVKRFAVLVSGRPETIIGRLVFEMFREGAPSYESNKHLAQVDIALLTPYRRQGFGKELLAKAVEQAKETGKTLIVGGSDEGDGKAFMKAIGAEVALQSRENRLHLDRLDWDMVEEWAEGGRERNPECDLLLFTGRMEESLVEEYCRVLTETLNQQPFDDLQIGDIVITPETNRELEDRTASVGGTWLRYLTREPDGRISGLTEMQYQPEQETIINQGMTGVKEEYRGRGLGKWLKAAMLLKLREEFPQVKVVSTRNASSNAAMLSINDRLGSRSHKEGTVGQITVEALEAYLSR